MSKTNFYYFICEITPSITDISLVHSLRDTLYNESKYELVLQFPGTAIYEFGTINTLEKPWNQSKTVI